MTGPNIPNNLLKKRNENATVNAGVKTAKQVMATLPKQAIPAGVAGATHMVSEKLTSETPNKKMKVNPLATPSMKQGM